MPEDTIVIMPAHNEAQTVGSLVHDVLALGYAVIVVDDASSDATADTAEAAGAYVLRLADNLGAWGATQCGMRLALHWGYRRVVTCDADGQHHPESIPALVEQHHLTGVDVVVGACPGRGSRARQVAWRLFKALTGLDVHDLTSGLRVYSHRSLKLLASPAGSLIDYQDVGVLLLLRENGLSLAEHPVSMTMRSEGHSRIFRNWFSVLEYMTFTLILAVCGNPRPGKEQRL